MECECPAIQISYRKVEIEYDGELTGVIKHFLPGNQNPGSEVKGCRQKGEL